MKARDLWTAILQSQIETGTPYMCYKDAVNAKTNQKNLGTIKSSNLCTEIMEYTDADEVAVCNLASIALPKFVDVDAQTFDFEKLVEITSVVTKNLNRVIDANFYPVAEAQRSNLKHRPIGIGVQGLADVFMLLKIAFDSERAKKTEPRHFRGDLLCRAVRVVRVGGKGRRLRIVRRLANVEGQITVRSLARVR